MFRYLVTYIPSFRLARCGWLPHQAAILVAEEKNTLRVQAATMAAQKAGIRKGMSAAAARALVPHLETDTTNGTDPIYGVNWGTLKPVFLSGEYMREEGPTQVPGQHTTMQVFVDSTLNFMCTDRRRNFLLSKVS